MGLGPNSALSRLSEKMKRPKTDSDSEEVENHTVDRIAAISGASASVRNLALTTLQENVGILSKPDNVKQLESLVHSFAGKVLRSGPGTQPFHFVIHAFRGIIGGDILWDSIGGNELIQLIASWDVSNATAEVKAFADRFLESEGGDPYFCAGDHMGGECENALFEFVDAALTLLTIE